MTTTERSAELARGWIEAWIRMDLDWLGQKLSPDFVHVSPFGRLEGRDHYLDTVEPMARKSVVKLTIKDVIASGDRAAVRFDNHTPGGIVESCDWVRIESDRIREVRSFYDSKKIRETLSPDDQRSLGG
jgi:hypothetical protein